MSRSPELYQWHTEMAQHFPHLSQPMVMGLALWSLGMIVVRSCSLAAIADKTWVGIRCCASTPGARSGLRAGTTATR